jgi:hypothetical protein
MLNFKRTVLCQMLVFCCLAVAPLSAFAIGTVSLSSSNGTVFTVMANGFDAPGGFHLTVTYDATRLSISNSRVVAGSLVSGGLFVANTGFTGSLQLIVVAPNAMKGSGPIATLTFDRKGDSSGNLGVSGTVVNIKTAYLPATFRGWSDPSGSGGDPSTTAGGTDTTNTPTPTPQPTTITTGTSSTGTPVVGGTLTMPSDDAGMREHKDVPGQPAPVPPQPMQQEPRDGSVPPPASSEAPAAPETPVATKKAPEEQLRPAQSVLEKFRLFTGEKTPATLIALFDAGQGIPFSQTPAVAIADGKSSVKITISKVAGDRAPNFAFNHAKYLSLKQTGDGEWQVEVMPEKGTVRASISMVTEAAQQEIPLTVSPQADVDLDKSGSVTEADFQLFLKTRGSDEAPKFDLNGDGKRDYQDDYIFTANYLIMVAKEKTVPAAKKVQ